MELNKQEWLNRCAKRFQKKAKVDAEVAKEAAEALYHALGDDIYDPEYAADDEMECWSD